MSVSRKFFLVFVAFFGISGFSLLLTDIFFQQYLAELRKQSLNELIRNTENILEIRSTNLKNLVRDYTYRDDMVQFAEQPDTQWAIENLFTAMGNFSVDEIWIYNLHGAETYHRAVNTTEAMPVKHSPAYIRRWIKEKTFTHFYLAQPAGMMEIVGGPIHPSSDYERNTPSRGYLILARLWTDQYLLETGNLLKSRLSILYGDSSHPNTDPSGSVLLSEKSLPSFDRSTAGHLIIENDWPYGDAFNRLMNWQIGLGIVISVLLLILFPFLFYRWLLRPIRQIRDLLREKQLEPQPSLLNRQDEFGLLARLVENRNRLTSELENTVRQLKETENKKTLSEEQYRLLFNRLLDGAIVVDSEYYKCMEVNQAAKQMFCFTGETYKDITPLELSDEPGLILETLEKAKKTGHAFIPCHRQRRMDGTVFFTEISVFATHWFSDDALCMIIHDITQRLETEAAIQQQQQLLRAIIDISPDYIFVKDRNRKMILVNDSFATVFNRLNDERTNTDSDLIQLFGLTGKRDFDTDMLVIEQRREIVIPEEKYTLPNGNVQWLQILKRPIFGVNGEVTHIVGIARDFTFHKEAENRILRLYHLYALLSQVNQAIVRIKSRKELISEILKITIQYGNFVFAWYGEQNSSDSLYHPVDAYGMPETTAQTLIQNTPVPADLQNPLIIQSPFLEKYSQSLQNIHNFQTIALVPVISRQRPKAVLALYDSEDRIRDEDDIALLREIGQDIAFAMDALETDTQRARIEYQLQILFHAIDQNPASVIIMNADEQTEYVNKKFTEVTGYSTNELLGRTPNFMKEGFSPDIDFRTMKNILRQGKPWHGEFRWQRKTGELYWVSAMISPVITNGKIAHFIAIMEDITRRKQMEHELLQAQKMDSIGRLAGGVAHDFNNLLTAILGYSNLIQQKLPSDYPLREDIEAIIQTARRGANLTRQLLAFSRKQVMHIETVNINELVQNALHLLRRILEENIDLKVQLHHEPLFVRIDRSQMEQVLMNLVVNARDAMEQGGTIDIIVSKQTENNLAVLCVRDTGCGIAPDLMEHIFEPFFTTKEKGKGTGLGLSTVYGIVRQSGGDIYVESEPDHGSVFTIVLPINAEEKTIQPTQQIVHPTPAAQKTIFIAEDDEILCKLICEILNNAGHKTIFALRGDSAAQMAETLHETIDLLLTDMIMPGLNGIELAEKLRQFNPNIKVLFMSGYPQDKLQAMQFSPDHAGFIQKPFSPDTLILMLNQLTE